MNNSDRRSLARRILAMLALGIALGTVLGGCGGSGGVAASGSSASSTPSSSGGMDAFIAEVSRILGVSSDTAEPQSTGQINATTPDNTEPAPVS